MQRPFPSTSGTRDQGESMAERGEPRNEGKTGRTRAGEAKRREGEESLLPIGNANPSETQPPEDPAKTSAA